MNSYLECEQLICGRKYSSHSSYTDSITQSSLSVLVSSSFTNQITQIVFYGIKRRSSYQYPGRKSHQIVTYIVRYSELHKSPLWKVFKYLSCKDRSITQVALMHGFCIKMSRARTNLDPGSGKLSCVRLKLCGIIFIMKFITILHFYMVRPLAYRISLLFFILLFFEKSDRNIPTL